MVPSSSAAASARSRPAPLWPPCSRSPAEIRATSEVPLLLFTYLNPVLRYGLERLAADAAAAGIDGCLLTDASVEEAETYVGAMHRHGLDTVFLAAPTSTERRLKLVAQYSTGFVYLVSRTGVTGEQDSLSASVAPLVAGGPRGHRSAPRRRLRRLQARTRRGTRPAGGGRRRGQRLRPPDRAERGRPGAGNQTRRIHPRTQERLRSHGMTPEEAQAKLEEYRMLIDDVDRRIVALLNERTARRREHRPRQTRGQLPVYEPKREDQVFANITGANHGPLTHDSVRGIFERIIDEMRSIQRQRMIQTPPEEPKC